MRSERIKSIILVLLLLDVAIMSFLLWQNSIERKQLNKDWARLYSEAKNHRAITDSLKSATDSLSFIARSLEVQLDALDHDDYYLVVDTETRTFQLRKGKLVIREGLCGVGKGFTAHGARSWNFETPKGERKVINKNENPAWNRPSWHWQEQGKAVPEDFITFSPNMPEHERQEAYRILSAREKDLVRSVPGALGRYSLGLGDGYYIHYGTGLGEAQSHGCIRLSSEDLEAIYRVLSVGDAVYIY